MEKLKNEELEEEKLVSLISVKNQIEYDLLAGLLSCANIPIFKDYLGADRFLNNILGLGLAGINVLVQMKFYNEAMEIINSRE